MKFNEHSVMSYINYSYPSSINSSTEEWIIWAKGKSDLHHHVHILRHRDSMEVGDWTCWKLKNCREIIAKQCT